MDNNQEVRLRRAQEAQRLVNAYHRVFETEEGRMVLEDLRREFRLEGRVFAAVSKGRHFEYDALTAALTDGARAVVIYIGEKLKGRVRADVEVTLAAPAVRES